MTPCLFSYSQQGQFCAKLLRDAVCPMLFVIGIRSCCDCDVGCGWVGRGAYLYVYNWKRWMCIYIMNWYVYNNDKNDNDDDDDDNVDDKDGTGDDTFPIFSVILSNISHNVLIVVLSNGEASVEMVE